MIAQADPRAADARAILRNAGIDPVKDPRNLIVISQGLHKSMHTNNYYRYINRKLENCTSTSDVERALLEIKVDIQFANETGIRR